MPESPGIVNVADNEPITQRDAYAWLAAKLNRPLPEAAAAGPAGKKTRREQQAGLQRESCARSAGSRNFRISRAGWKSRSFRPFRRLGA